MEKLCIFQLQNEVVLLYQAAQSRLNHYLDEETEYSLFTAGFIVLLESLTLWLYAFLVGLLKQEQKDNDYQELSEIL